MHWIYETVQYIISVDLPTVSELYCTVLLYPLLEGIFIYCTELHRTTLHCTALHCPARHCTTLHCTALHCTTLPCTALHYTALRCTLLHCTIEHCTALPCSDMYALSCAPAVYVTVIHRPHSGKDCCTQHSHYSHRAIHCISNTVLQPI